MQAKPPRQMALHAHCAARIGSFAHYGWVLCRCVGSLHLAVTQCKRGQARNREHVPASEDTDLPDAPAANAPAGVVGLQAVQLGEQLLEGVHLREQKLWSLQLDVRDLRNRLEDRRSAAEAAQAHSLVVRHHCSNVVCHHVQSQFAKHQCTMTGLRMHHGIV